MYALVKGYNLNVGKIIEQSIMDYAANNLFGNIPHTALITLLCIIRGIKVAEHEEKSMKASPLTLTGVLKTLVEGEEVKIIRKRRRTKERPRETIPIIEVEREFENEERGVFEDYIEQPVFFPTTVEEIPAPPVSTENRGKQRAEA